MGKVRRLGNERERGGREMYSGKLAPHKSGPQSSREEAVKNGQRTRTHTCTPTPGSRGRGGGTGRENEERRIEKKQNEEFLERLSLCIFTFGHNRCACCPVVAQRQAGEAAAQADAPMSGSRLSSQADGITGGSFYT